MATAREKETDNIANQVIICTLCKEELKKPKLLSCQHSFCTPCLIQYQGNICKEQPFCCPTCQMIIEIPENCVDKLPDNYIYYIVKDACKYQSSQKCVSCEQIGKETDATYACLDCGDTLCCHCKEWHLRFSVTKHHEVVTLSDLLEGKFKTEQREKKVLYCSHHSTDGHKVPLTSYCNKCECLVCIECMQDDHNNHTFAKIHTVRESHQRSIDERIARLQKSQRDQDIDVEKAITDTQQKWVQQQKEVNDTVFELHEKISKIKDEKLAELKKHYEKEIKYLNKLLNAERKKRSSVIATVAVAKTFSEICSDAEFLRHEGDVMKRVESRQNEQRIGFERNIVTIEKQSIYTQDLRKAFGSIETKTMFSPHINNIEKSRILFKKAIENGDMEIYGVSNNSQNVEILVAGSKTSIIALDQNGCFKRTIGKEWTNDFFCRVDLCSDIHVVNSDIYYTVYQKKRRKLVIADQNREVKKSVMLPYDDQQKSTGLNLVVDKDNTAYIASRGMDIIYEWTPAENKMIFFALMGSPKYMCLTPDGELVVSSYSYVRVFSKKGILKWTYSGTLDKTPLKNASGICCGVDGYIYVVDKDNCRIQVIYDKTCVGIIPIHEEVKKYNDVPLIITADQHLIYCYGNTIVRMSIWENNNKQVTINK